MLFFSSLSAKPTESVRRSVHVAVLLTVYAGFLDFFACAIQSRRKLLAVFHADCQLRAACPPQYHLRLLTEAVKAESRSVGRLSEAVNQATFHRK